MMNLILFEFFKEFGGVVWYKKKNLPSHHVDLNQFLQIYFIHDFLCWT